MAKRRQGWSMWWRVRWAQNRRDTIRKDVMRITAGYVFDNQQCDLTMPRSQIL